MADKRQKITGRRTSPTFAAKPHHIFRADCKNGIPSPASVLSHMAAHLLDNLTAQLNGKNNGDLSAAPKTMKLYGWNSQGSINKALTELLALGFIEQTRQGGKNQCSLYAVTQWPPSLYEIHGDKPKGMHWKTFRRLQADHDAMIVAGLDGKLAALEKLVRQLGWPDNPA